jgi:hypothetical protein
MNIPTSVASSSSRHSVPINIPHQSRNMDAITRGLPISSAAVQPIPATDAISNITRPFPFPPHPSHQSLPLPITPYQPAHVPMHQGHPPATPQPFLGMQSLGQGISCQVNEQRLASASVNLRRRTALPTRSRTRRTTRGPAVLPPVLRSPQTSCYVDSGNGSMNIQIRVKVYPPPVCNWTIRGFQLNLSSLPGGWR